MLSAFGREPACCYRTFFLCLVFPVIGNLSLKILTYLCAIPSDKGPKISSTLKSAFIRSYFVSRTESLHRLFVLSRQSPDSDYVVRATTGI